VKIQRKEDSVESAMKAKCVTDSGRLVLLSKEIQVKNMR
jgi:hypothetical protein